MSRKKRQTIGRQETLVLPDLGEEPILAKVDTGARSSSLHALDLEIFEKEGIAKVKFRSVGDVSCELPIAHHRSVKSSNGRSTQRVFVETLVVTPDGMEWPMIFSLADRSKMKCPILLGRRALAGRFVVDVEKSQTWLKRAAKKKRLGETS